LYIQKVISAYRPVAGFGTRLLPATKSQPRRSAGRAQAIVQYVVEELAARGRGNPLRHRPQQELHREPLRPGPELMRLLSAGRARPHRGVEVRGVQASSTTRAAVPARTGRRHPLRRELCLANAPSWSALGDSIRDCTQTPGAWRDVRAFESRRASASCGRGGGPRPGHHYGIASRRRTRATGFACRA